MAESLILPSEAHRRFAVTAETRVESSVPVVAGNGEVVVASDTREPRRHDFPVRLEGDGVGTVLVSEVGEDESLVPERLVETTGRGQARLASWRLLNLTDL